jgi:hypothetical protein
MTEEVIQSTRADQHVIKAYSSYYASKLGGTNFNDSTGRVLGYEHVSIRPYKYVSDSMHCFRCQKFRCIK